MVSGVESKDFFETGAKSKTVKYKADTATTKGKYDMQFTKISIGNETEDITAKNPILDSRKYKVGME